MSSERAARIAQYEAGFDEVVKSLDGFPRPALREHPIPGKWSACEIVHHLADSETQAGIRLRRLLVEDHPVIQPYDQEAWASGLKYMTRDMAPSLEAFRAARSTTAQLLTSMSEGDWTREGWHPEHGLYTPDHWLKIYAVHAHNHASQIRRLKDALKG